jgi:quercetin dioxygenase-like cupin family protein
MKNQGRSGFMRSANVVIFLCLMLFWSFQSPLASRDGADTATEPSKPTPLILEKNEGERRIWRPIEGAEGWLGQPAPFILKVDPQNGGSSHLVFVTEDLPPGGKIETHRHPGSDEILFLQNGLAKVSLGDLVREVHGGATVFIPANTWVSVNNIGSDAIGLIGIFSAPGFEEYMRAESVREREKVVPLSKAEDEEIMRKHWHAVIYK